MVSTEVDAVARAIFVHIYSMPLDEWDAERNQIKNYTREVARTAIEALNNYREEQ